MKRCGHICIAGPPNAGKSTLMNHIMGEKVSIVTHKPQTTRVSVECVYTKGDHQAIFVDTPGILKPKGLLQKSMSREAHRAVSRAHIKVLILDASSNLDRYNMVIPAQILILNKVDLVKEKKLLLGLARDLTSNKSIKKVFMISALKGSGVEDFLLYTLSQLPEQDWLYKKERKTNLSKNLWAAEMTREIVFLHTHQEIPYNLWIKTLSWKERDNDICIRQNIYVDRESHKLILVGSKGSKISTIGEISRKKMECELGKEVHLFLQVKVERDWQRRRNYYHTWSMKSPK